MSSRKGSLLEEIVERIFKSSGFKTERNIRLNYYEVDVYAKLDDYDIVIECKEPGSSYVNVSNLIHQWVGKNREIKAKRVLLVVYGQDTSSKEEFAEKNKIYIWNSKDVDELLELSIKNPEEAKTTILDKLEIKTAAVTTLRKRMADESVRKWKLDYKTLCRVFKHSKTFSQISAIRMNEEKLYVYGYEIVSLFMKYELYPHDPTIREKIVQSCDKSLTDTENKKGKNFFDTIIFPGFIGQKEVDLAIKHEMRCLVCEGIITKKIKTSFLTSEEIPEINTKKILIITEDDLKEWHKKYKEEHEFDNDFEDFL